MPGAPGPLLLARAGVANKHAAQEIAAARRALLRSTCHLLQILFGRSLSNNAGGRQDFQNPAFPRIPGNSAKICLFPLECASPLLINPTTRRAPRPAVDRAPGANPLGRSGFPPPASPAATGWRG